MVCYFCVHQYSRFESSQLASILSSTIIHSITAASLLHILCYFTLDLLLKQIPPESDRKYLWLDYREHEASVNCLLRRVPSRQTNQPCLISTASLVFSVKISKLCGHSTGVNDGNQTVLNLGCMKGSLRS